MDSSDSLLPPDQLECSPSLKDGVEPEEELLHRAFGGELVQEAGILLRLPQVVMATAQNLLHRFFYRCVAFWRGPIYFASQPACFCLQRKSLKKFDVVTVAMGCLLLACKTEEKPKILREVRVCCVRFDPLPKADARLRQIIYTFHRMYQRRCGFRIAVLELGGEQYNTWKNGLYLIL